MFALHGRILEVDLESGASRPLAVPEDKWRRYLGGAGLAARLFFENFDPGLEPLSGDNPLMVMLGPLASSGLAGASRFAVCAKSPLTGFWGESSCGGNFAPELQAAGYDGIVVRGAARQPVVLLVDDGRVSLEPAAELWGRDSYDTIDAVKQRYRGRRAVKVLAIGGAGERLVRFAAACHDKHDFAGRCGMGAVMGAKKLKAIAVRGTGRVPVADAEGLKQLRRRVQGRIKESVPAQSLREMGTNSTMDLGMMTGDVPIKNWTRGEALEISAEIGGPTMTEKFLVRPGACWRCPIACRRVMKNEQSPWRMAEGPGPEYETAASFGSLLENADAGSILRVNELCNRHGLDTISCGAVVALAVECAERGILDAGQLDGLALGWGRAEAIVELVERIARRQGLGDVLAEGSRRAAQRIGGGAERLTCEIKGLDLPMHDPRAFHGMGLAYMMSNRGACHNAHLVHPIEQGIATWTELGFSDNYDGQSSAGKGELVKRAEDFGVQCNSLSLCVFNMWCYGSRDPLDALRVTCGWDVDMDEYFTTGARTWLIKRALNCLMGLRAEDDRLPEKILTPVPDGGAAGSVPDEELLRREYYAARGLDASGRPTAETLAAVGLEDVAGRLQGA